MVFAYYRPLRRSAFFFSGRLASQPFQASLLALLLVCGFSAAAAQADGGSTNVSTGITSGSILGNGNQQATDTGVAINGNVSGSNLNNNQNRNLNVVQPVVVTAPEYSSGGRGGSSALILPRNPLALGNASNGRSNFGLQFGVQNNPGISAITNGRENGLGWFMQGGVTIPFGKIPMGANARNPEYEQLRQSEIDARRQVFGAVTPTTASTAGDAKVQGKVVGLNAYNYATIGSDKLGEERLRLNSVGEIVSPQPKVLALKPSIAFDQPLNTGVQIGQILVGKEYPYLGHTRSGWVKVLLPSGKEAWTSTHFEYVKVDYTEVDTLAVAPVSTDGPVKLTLSPAPHREPRPVSLTHRGRS